MLAYGPSPFLSALDSDIGAKVDAQGFKNSWVGYKLHIDSTDAGIPVSCILSSASLHDSQVPIPLADMSAQRVTYLYECMDSAYDAAQIHDHSRKHDRVSIFDTNPRSNKGLKEALARKRKAANRAGFVHPTVQRYERSHQMLCSTNYSKGVFSANICLWLATLITL